MRTSNTRKIRAYSLLAQNKVDRISDVIYRVWSQSGNGHYIVVREGLEWKCECPDFAFNQVVCKHIHAAEQYRLNEQATFPFEKEGESLYEIQESVLVCKFCGSERIIKRGHRNTQRGKVQRFSAKIVNTSLLLTRDLKK